jgi:hypothetical protein
MILEVCHHFLLDGNKSVFADHELGANEDMIEDDHQVNLIKWQQTNIIQVSLHVREALHTPCGNQLRLTGLAWVNNFFLSIHNHTEWNGQ